jgi:hypothetical protein
MSKPVTIAASLTTVLLPVSGNELAPRDVLEALVAAQVLLELQLELEELLELELLDFAQLFVEFIFVLLLFELPALPEFEPLPEPAFCVVLPFTPTLFTQVVDELFEFTFVLFPVAPATPPTSIAPTTAVVRICKILFTTISLSLGYLP